MLSVVKEIESRKSDCAFGRAPTFDRKATIQLKQQQDEKESNEHRIDGRIKQIQYGKNTVGYDNYVAAVPKEQRKKIPSHPQTPDPYDQISKRNFDGKVKAWRRALHLWDSPDFRPDSDKTIKPSASKGTKRKIQETSNHPFTPSDQNKRQKSTTPSQPATNIEAKKNETEGVLFVPLGEEVDDQYLSDVQVDYEDVEEEDALDTEDVL